MQLATNYSTTYETLLTHGIACVPIEAHLLTLLLLYSVVACSKFSQYLSILKGYGASKTSRLYRIVEKIGGENVYEFSFSQCLA